MMGSDANATAASCRKLSHSCFKAVCGGRFQKVKFLLDNGVSVKTRNERNQNLLVAALYINDDDKRSRMMSYLLQRGVAYRGCDDEGRDVVAWACILGRPEQLQQVFDAATGDVDLLSRDAYGSTPLHHAVIHGQINVVRILIDVMCKFRLSVDVQDDNGLTPYLYARRLGHHAIADFLVRKGEASRRQFYSKTFHTS